MKSAAFITALLVGLLGSIAAHADQFALPYGWTGGYGIQGQCLLSNGPATQPSWQACPGGGGSGTVTSITAGTGLTGGTITTSGTIALSTPVSVATGGTGTGTSTGSGSVVLSTSPALVTPALGTPSALVLTNATGLPDGALSANVPLLNASNSFTGTTQTVSSTEPRIRLNQTGAGTDLKLWDWDLASGIFCLRTRTDADAAGKNVFCATRGTTTVLSAINFGNATDNPPYNFLGTNIVTAGGYSSLSGSDATPGFNFNNTGNTGYGFRLAGTSAIRVDMAGAANTSFTPTQFQTPSVVSNGTKFTTTGCSISSTTGGGAAGTFTLGANTCTAVITLNGATGSTATNGWACFASDRTAPTVLISQSASTTTTASFSIPAGAGATDVVGFGCMGY